MKGNQFYGSENVHRRGRPGERYLIFDVADSVSGVVVAMFVLGRVAHRIHTCGHMWLPTCLSMCWRFGPVGQFFVYAMAGFCVVG